MPRYSSVHESKESASVPTKRGAKESSSAPTRREPKESTFARAKRPSISKQDEYGSGHQDHQDSSSREVPSSTDLPSIRAGAFKPTVRKMQGKTPHASKAYANNQKAHADAPEEQASQQQKKSSSGVRGAKHGASKRSLSERIKNASTRSKVFMVIFALLFVALLVATGILCWNQWLRYDDHKDFQGTWQIAGTKTSFVITDTEMKLTDEVAYTYELDTFNKTISFSFGNLSGGGSYAFSPDRADLIITESNSGSDGSSVPSKLTKLLNADGSTAVHDDESSN